MIEAHVEKIDWRDLESERVLHQIYPPTHYIILYFNMLMYFNTNLVIVLSYNLDYVK